MVSLFTAMICDDDGATIVEYGLLIALIAMVVLIAITTLGQNLSSLFSNAAGSV